MSRRYLHMILCFLLGLPAVSQTQVEVMTKTVNHRFDYVAGYGIEVEGKSATISIQSWDKNEIGVEMKLISKGLTREISERELAFQKYVIDEIDQKYVIRNYLLLPSGLNKLSTIQETEIKIHVPLKADLSLTSLFGTVSIESVTGNIELESKYGELLLKKVSGAVRLKSTFGDLILTDFSGALTADLEHTATYVDDYMGSAVVKSKLGDQHWTNIGRLTRLKILAEKSNVELKFKNKDLVSYHWQLRTKYGAIVFPLDQSETRKITFGDENNPSIEVSTDYGKITVEE